MEPSPENEWGTYAVVPFCKVAPLTTVFRGRFCGSGMAFAATITGPIGVELSDDLGIIIKRLELRERYELTKTLREAPLRDSHLVVPE